MQSQTTYDLKKALDTENESIILAPEDIWLITKIREVKFGMLKIDVRQGKPFEIEIIKQTFRPAN
jgi:hypothetical protein